MTATELGSDKARVSTKVDLPKVAEINFCSVRGALTKAKCLRHHIAEGSPSA